MAEDNNTCNCDPTAEVDEYVYIRSTSVDSNEYTYMKQLPAEGNEEQTDISGERDGYTYMRQLPVQNQQQTEESNSLLPEGSDADDLDYSHAYIGRPQGDSSDHLECNYSYTGRNLGQDSNAANTTDDTDQSYSYVGKLQGDSSDNQANNYYYTERRPGQGGDTADDMDYNSRYVGNQPGDNNGDMNYYSYPEGAPVGGSEHMPYYSYPDGTQVVGNSDNLISTTQNSAYSNRIITSTNQGLPGYDHNSTVHLYEPTPTRPLPPPPPGNTILQPPAYWQPYHGEIQTVNMSAPNGLQPASLVVQKPPPINDHGICPTMFAVIAIIVSVLFSCWVGLICSIPAIILASNASTWSAHGHTERARKYRKWSFGCSLATIGFTIVAWVTFAAFLAGIICRDGTTC